MGSCTLDTCENGECKHYPARDLAIAGIDSKCCVDETTCDDGNGCTVDTCEDSQCKFTVDRTLPTCQCEDASDCLLSSMCVSVECENNKCVYTKTGARVLDEVSVTGDFKRCCTDDRECGDLSNPCSVGKCNDLGYCEIDVVAETGCCRVDADCNDSKECTYNKCINNKCETVALLDALETEDVFAGLNLRAPIGCCRVDAASACPSRRCYTPICVDDTLQCNNERIIGCNVEVNIEIVTDWVDGDNFCNGVSQLFPGMSRVDCEVVEATPRDEGAAKRQETDIVWDAAVVFYNSDDTDANNVVSTLNSLVYQNSPSLGDSGLGGLRNVQVTSNDESPTSSGSTTDPVNDNNGSSSSSVPYIVAGVAVAVACVVVVAAVIIVKKRNNDSDKSRRHELADDDLDNPVYRESTGTNSSYSVSNPSFQDA